MGCQEDTGAFDLEENERYKSLIEGMRSAIQEMKVRIYMASSHCVDN